MISLGIANVAKLDVKDVSELLEAMENECGLNDQSTFHLPHTLPGRDWVSLLSLMYIYPERVVVKVKWEGRGEMKKIYSNIDFELTLCLYLDLGSGNELGPGMVY
ncbi:hypothetical protein Tco_0475176 [Tanacetum coccineum]